MSLAEKIMIAFGTLALLGVPAALGVIALDAAGVVGL